MSRKARVRGVDSSTYEVWVGGAEDGGDRERGEHGGWKAAIWQKGQGVEEVMGGLNGAGMKSRARTPGVPGFNDCVFIRRISVEYSGTRTRDLKFRDNSNPRTLALTAFRL